MKLSQFTSGNYAFQQQPLPQSHAGGSRSTSSAAAGIIAIAPIILKQAILSHLQEFGSSSGTWTLHQTEAT
jgi:hypothetical protein